jgi:hypothetical protein
MPSAQNSNASPLPGDEGAGVEEAMANEQISPTTLTMRSAEPPMTRYPL